MIDDYAETMIQTFTDTAYSVSDGKIVVQRDEWEYSPSDNDREFSVGIRIQPAPTVEQDKAIRAVMAEYLQNRRYFCASVCDSKNCKYFFGITKWKER